MKAPLNWLKEFIDITQSPNQIGKVLTSLGLEVEGIDSLKPNFTNVVIAKVLSTEPHPNADKLTIAQVSDGDQTFQVVCGAPNCRAGMKTALARIGGDVGQGENQFKIKKAKIRGVESFGMLCSGKELGISAEEDGILEFPEVAKEGTELDQLYGDTIFEIGLTPNLSHCMSIVGIAREIKAALNLKIKTNEVKLEETGSPFTTAVEVIDKEGSPRYMARGVEELKVAASPDWLKQKLESVGIRSINNVVDVTNLVMIETGQPLHAFDLDKIEGQKVIVRSAIKSETLCTLDGKERELEEGMLVIADARKPLAVAGVMGGKESEVSDSTRRILIESAYFDPSSVRRTSKKLALSSDASKRFERGADPLQAEYALAKAASLIAELTGGKVQKGIADLKAKTFEPKIIMVRLSRVNALLGTHISASEVENIFLRLGFEVEFDGSDRFTVKVPTFRADVSEEIDLVEEVARLYGYDNIKREPARFEASKMPHAPLYLFENEVRRKLIGEGLQEFITCDLIGPSALKIVQGDENLTLDTIKVLNPVSLEQSVLRTSLLPGLLQVVKHNFDRESKDIAGFEVGRVHTREGDKFDEEGVVGIILSGSSTPHSYDPKPQEFDFRDLKGILENFLEMLGIHKSSFRPSTNPQLHPGRQAAIFVGALEVGMFGEVHPQVIRRLDINQRVFYAELNLTDLMKVRTKDIRFKELSVFPASERDWTITLLEKAPVAQVMDAIRSVPSQLLEAVYLSDMYRSTSLGADKKNATFHFVYRDPKGTIEQETVDKEHERIISSALHLITGCLP